MSSSTNRRRCPQTAATLRGLQTPRLQERKSAAQRTRCPSARRPTRMPSHGRSTRRSRLFFLATKYSFSPIRRQKTALHARDCAGRLSESRCQTSRSPRQGDSGQRRRQTQSSSKCGVSAPARTKSSSPFQDTARQHSDSTARGGRGFRRPSPRPTGRLSPPFPTTRFWQTTLRPSFHRRFLPSPPQSASATSRVPTSFVARSTRLGSSQTMSQSQRQISYSPTQTSRRRLGSISSAFTSLQQRGRAAPFGQTRQNRSSTAWLSTAIPMLSRPTRYQECQLHFSAHPRSSRPPLTNAMSDSPIQPFLSFARRLSPPSSRMRSRWQTGECAICSRRRGKSPQGFSTQTKATSRNARPSSSAQTQTRRRTRGETSLSPGCQPFSPYLRFCCTSASPTQRRQSPSQCLRPSRF